MMRKTLNWLWKVLFLCPDSWWGHRWSQFQVAWRWECRGCGCIFDECTGERFSSVEEYLGGSGPIVPPRGGSALCPPKDSIPAMLDPGVSYLPRSVIEKFGLEKLRALNGGGEVMELPKRSVTVIDDPCQICGVGNSCRGHVITS
jgi:hypothetical protein